MTRLFFGLFTALVLSTSAPGADAKKDLAQAVQKTSRLKAYCFSIDRQPGQGAKGAVEGAYEKGKPVFFRAERIEFYKKGAALVYQQAGKWHKSRTGTLSDPLLILGASAKVRGARLPHEELAGFEKNLTKVRKTGRKEGGSDVYTADIDTAGVKRLAPTEYAGVARTGKAKIWVNNKGQVVKYAVTLKLKGRLGNAEIDGSTTWTVALSDLSKATVNVPDEVQKILK
jgi:hypothetical protein